MSDYRLMYDAQCLCAIHLGGKDHTLTIARVEAGTLIGEGGKKSKKPIVYFKGKELGLGLCKTNARTIAAMYGNDTRRWVGKQITIYPTKTTFGKETVDCIRIRPMAPEQQPQQPQQPQQAPPREPGDDTEEVDRARPA